MSISEDATTPGAFTGSTASGTLTVTSSSFSPPSGSYVVVLVAIGHNSGTPSVAVTDSGSHTWTTGPTEIGASNTWSGIYYTYLAGGASGITVSAKNSTTQGQAMQMDVRVWDGVAVSQAGAGSNTATGSSTSWTGSLTTTTANSWVAIAVNGNHEDTVTPNSNTSTLNNFQSSAGTSCLSGRQSSNSGTVTPGATTFGWTESGVAVEYAFSALEFLATSGSIAGSASGNSSGTGTAQGIGGKTAIDNASATGTAQGNKSTSGSGKAYATATSKAAGINPQVVNQWANSYGQGTTFTTITSALQSCVVTLNAADSVGGGTGIPTAGNWLFVIASWTQDPSIAEVHVGVGDDIHEWYREYPASSISGNVRTAIAYCPNIGTFGNNVLPQNVYVAPDGEIAAINVLVVEVSGLGPWDTVATGAPVTNYAAAATSLSLSLGAPGAASFFIASVGGDSTAAGQTFAPAGWGTLSTRSQSNGANQLASNYMTSAYLPSSSSSQSVSASASSTDLSGFIIAVYASGNSPIPAKQNPNWPYVIVEAGFGSGFNTPDSEITWTDISKRPWNWEENTGIQFQLGQLQATNGTVEFDNYDSELTPLNAGSPYYPNVLPGTPIRIRAALGTIGGNTVDRWYLLQRNAQQWGEEIADTFRKYCPVTITDLWAALSDIPPTFYRSEVFEDGPYAWWPLNDQPGTSGVLPVNFLNAAAGNTNTLNVAIAPGKGTVNAYRDTGGNTTVPGQSSAGAQSGFPPGAAIYQAGTNQGWMFGDPQSTVAAIEAGSGNPVTAQPGSASWQASGQAGTTGSNGFFLYCNDNNFPALSGGVAVEVWFNVAYYAGSNGWVIGGNSAKPITQQPYNQPITVWEMATASKPVCILQLSAGAPGSGGQLNLITYNGSTATSHSIYAGSDLRDNSWHMVTVNLTTTTWQVWLNGGANANVSGTATGMTSAWTWLIANGDLGANGGSSAGTGLVHGGNMSLSHIAVYPYQLPYYRVLDHYWAAVTAFGQLPAPQAVQITWVNQYALIPAVGSLAPAQNAYTGDGSTGVTGGGYTATNGIGMAAIVTATAPGGITSGPSAWTFAAVAFTDSAGAGEVFTLAWPFVAWTGVAPTFNVYTANSVGSELESSVTSGDSEAFSAGYGGSATPTGISNVSGASGASPPTAASNIGDTVGQRIERLMRGGKTSSPNRCIDPASLLVQAPGTQGGGVQVGAAIQEIQQSDSGMLFVDNLNHLCYWQRPHLASQYNSPIWNIGPSAGKYVYAKEIEWITDPQRIWNTITIEPLSPTGAALPEYTPTNSSAVLTSQTQYGAQPLQITSFLQSTTEMQSQANWLFSTWGTPRRRAEKVKIDAASNPAFWPIVLGANVGDVVTLEDWQIGGGGSVYTMRITEMRRHLEYGANAAGNSQVVAAVWLTLDYEPTSYWT